MTRKSRTKQAYISEFKTIAITMLPFIHKAFHEKLIPGNTITFCYNTAV